MSRKLVLVLAATLAVSWLATGCNSDKKTDDKTGQGNQAKTPDKAPDRPVSEPKPVGLDALDSKAAEVQGIFPKTDAQWVKVRQVEFYPAADLGKMTSEVGFYRPYGVDWAADALYQLGRDENQRLVVQLFHCADSSDAYGLMSVASDEPYKVQIGQEARGGQPLLVHVWSGNFYLCLWSENRQGLTFIRAMQDLGREIVSHLPKNGAKPALVKLLPTASQVPGQVHYFRGPDSVRSSGLTTVIHERALANALQLGPQDKKVLAAYDVPGLYNKCRIFIAQYADPAKAIEAHDRLVSQQNEPTTRFAKDLMVGGREKSCVYGTLTTKEYGWLENSARGRDADEFPVFPTIRKRLAEPE